MAVSIVGRTKDVVPLTVVAKYYSKEGEISIEVVEDFWERETSWPNEAHLRKDGVRGIGECEKSRRTSSLRVRKVS